MPDDDYCSETTDHKHVPDWASLSTTNDGGETHVDVNCTACGRSGCVGVVKHLVEDICW